MGYYRVDYWGPWTYITCPVRSVRYSLEERPDGPAAMKVEYRAARQWWAELVEIEAADRKEAQLWWMDRTDLPLPATAAEAVELARAGALARARRVSICYSHDDPTPRLADVEVGPIPDWPR